MKIEPPHCHSCLECQTLWKELEKKREMMIETGMLEGFRSEKTIKTSTELDELLNQLTAHYLSVVEKR
ncbi:aspartyl-phosphate phosphatase Spo0E family protein [Fictibacillus fluitans]|uniref:Aspartyl-phosphate phosphatase Spo0E family protein n=1 Tax=Fictibacillus fluitans TaxID=3058422 RepID=A0ABT8HTC7_9BACL|nr:aspartyl-phosphate phosphatase Spo0E family protein [Fictibacillus sp. NE201]MDN4524024.1 aspartyl-phosphate phosphatase Spo0E family protein [Fictibacillus sp. NE201]